ncbi:MAG: AsmA family protein [Phycisphaerae bacterium]|nr:AsmA family protein [Phycisphaerae bacterium]
MAQKKSCLSGIVKLGVVVVVLAVAAVFAGVYYLDRLAKGAIEGAGTKVLGVNTTVDSVSIGLMSGDAGLRGLSIANPTGYASPEFLKLSTGEVQVTPKSLLENVVRIPKIELSNLSLTFDEKGDGDSNVKAILANAKRFAGSSEGKSEDAGKKFVIDELTITNITVVAHVQGLPLSDEGITVVVPKVQLKDIGSGGSDPVGLNQLSGLVVSAVLQAVLDASHGQLPAIFVQGITSGLGDLGGVFTKGVGSIGVDLGKGLEGLGGDLGKGLGKGVTESLGKAAGDVGKDVDNAVKGAGDAVKEGLDGLFKKK